MELIIKDVHSIKDVKLIAMLMKRLGFRAVKLNNETEDKGMSIAIEEGRKTGYVPEKTVMSILRKIQGEM